MIELSKTRDQVGVLLQDGPACYVMVTPTGPSKWGYIWLVELSDPPISDGQHVDELLVVSEHSPSRDALEWLENVGIDWAPDREIEAAAARELFPRSRLAQATQAAPAGTYSARWSRFIGN